ncbi:hypothetical protein Ahy_B06g083893 [Arachis hypogaea]|uniref:SWIM-type domain-containing protein n=1 Tax=Arachis hypogaea TaxID=3818 RepID=A0A444YQS3_ARAHY|nr:hypothetical protein Ahy_B06g083893 [Arachis hypogaea]
MSINEDDLKNDSDNDLGDDFDYQPNTEDDAEDDDVDSLDATSKSEEVCGVKRIADLMVEDIWNLEFRTEDEACQFYNAYSCWHGFVMRKDNVVRDNQGRIISRQLVCNKEGWRNMRYLDLDDRSREARDFDRRWAAILDKHNLVGSTWIEKTYETRSMWSHCFLQDKFFGYIRTTSQCEEPVMITSLEVYERSASCYFTRNSFKEIRNEIQRAGALNIKVLSTTLDKVEFSVIALGDPAKDRRVEVNRGKNMFSCSCKLVESRGIPCSHVFCAMKFENILEFPDSLIYKRWTKNAKNEFISTEMPVNDDVERSRKQGNSTPNINVEGINNPFVVKSKGAPSKRSSWKKKRACSNCHKYSHYYKRCPELMQHSVEGNPCDRSDGNASARDSGFSPERFANSSRSFSVKSKHHSGPKTKPFKKGGTKKFTATGMRNRNGKDNTLDERSLHESSESIDIASMNGFFNKNLFSLTQVKESKQDKGHSFTKYECVNGVMDEKCDTPHSQIDVRDPLPSSMSCGNKQGSYMALFASMHRTL